MLFLSKLFLSCKHRESESTCANSEVSLGQHSLVKKKKKQQLPPLALGHNKNDNNNWKKMNRLEVPDERSGTADAHVISGPPWPSKGAVKKICTNSHKKKRLLVQFFFNAPLPSPPRPGPRPAARNTRHGRRLHTARSTSRSARPKPERLTLPWRSCCAMRPLLQPSDIRAAAGERSSTNLFLPSASVQAGPVADCFPWEIFKAVVRYTPPPPGSGKRKRMAGVVSLASMVEA